MKNFKFLTLLWVILVFWTLAGCGSKTADNSDVVIEDITSETDAVINYNDTLVDLASSCIVSQSVVESTYDNEDATIEDIQTVITDTIKECSSAGEKIEKLWDWQWDSSLKDWALNIIQKYIAYYSKFNEILPYATKEELTEEENGIYESLLAEAETLDNELNIANNELVAIQENFAKDHWYELEVEENMDNEAE